MIALAQAALRLPDGTALESPAMTGLVVAIYVALLGLGLLAAVGLAFYFRDHHVDWEERKHLLRTRPWSAFEAVAMLVVLVALQLLTFALASLTRKVAGAAMTSPAQFIAQTIVLDWLGLVLVFAIMQRHQWTWHTAFGLEVRGRALLLGLVFFLAVMPFFWFYSSIYELGLRWFGVVPKLQEVAVAITNDQPLGTRLYLLGVAIVVAPLFEELLFRGIFLPALAKHMRIGWAVVLVSILFACIHVNVTSLLPLFIMSVAFSLAYLYSGNLLVPVLMHGLFNAFNLALLTALR
ncbi:MAG: type II CAAX endopeptidase family protein [Kiritimatiellaeota bacterium]|nr:type II CAAX endopeptidase family protein [Kiritimatiellota bacterium]